MSDTTPIISLIKMGQLGILKKLFGTVQIPEAVYHELTDSILNSILLIDEEKGRRVAKNMGVSITGTIGVLVNAYEEGFVDSDDIDV